eukprot:10730354-Ditylum_brightwellii.AAC.1
MPSLCQLPTQGKLFRLLVAHPIFGSYTIYGFGLPLVDMLGLTNVLWYFTNCTSQLGTINVNLSGLLKQCKIPQNTLALPANP